RRRVERRRGAARREEPAQDHAVHRRGARRRGHEPQRGPRMTPALPDSKVLLAALLDGKFPDARGRFGPFGGRYVPETLIPALERLERGVREHLHTSEFQAELARELTSWVGRPTALTHATRLSARWGGNVYLKREDLAHTGAHKINNATGQALLARRLG